MYEFSDINYTICYIKISLLNIKLDNLVNVVYYDPSATRSLLVREGRCDRLERAGKARASVIWSSVGITLPAISRPSHHPGDPDQKETEAPANADFVRSISSFCHDLSKYVFYISVRQ
jgi:hypothetical protein